MEMKFHYSSVKPEVAKRIAKCLRDKKPFGLSCPKSVVLFYPDKLKAIFVGNKQRATFEFNNDQDFINGISLQLLSHHDFVKLPELLPEQEASKIILLD